MTDWGLPLALVDPVLHHEHPATAKFAERSRSFTLCHALHLAGYFAELCLAHEQARAAMLPNLFLLGSRIALDIDTVTAIAESTVRDWQEWGQILQVRAENLPLIAAGVEQLGFALDDVKILLATHAHGDHVAGLAELKRLTGAQMWMSEQDAVLLENGGISDFRFGDGRTPSFEAVQVDRRLKDQDMIELGGVTLTAHHHPGHTKGATSFTFETDELETQAPARPATVPLREVLDLIRRDSRREPEQYLDETVVPHGGE